LKNAIKTLAIGFILFGSIILIQNNPTFATTNNINPTEVNTNIENSIIYTSTTKSAVNIGQTFKVGLSINNVQNISAEDITVKYDSSILNFLGVANIHDGLNIIEQTTSSAVEITTSSSIRLIIVSQGNGNVVNLQQDILYLNFQSVKTGCGAVYTENCKITDGDSMERKLTTNEMSGCIVNVNCDINGDGQFTLLDIGIISKHLGESVDNQNNNYTMDLVCDGVIDEKDLEKAKECLLNNSNYNDYECNNEQIN